MRIIGALLVLALASLPMQAMAQSTDNAYFRLGANSSMAEVVAPPPPLDPDFTDLIGSFSYPALVGVDGGGPVSADPTAFNPAGLTFYGYAWGSGSHAHATLDPITGRVTWSPVGFTGPSTVDVVAYTSEDFSEAIAATSSINVAPADDLPDPDDDEDTSGSFSYAPLNVAFGQVYTATPILGSGLTGYEYTWNGTPPNHATLDEETGVVSWDATQFHGVMEGEVYVVTTPDDPATAEYEGDGFAARTRITVAGDYEISVTPDDYAVQWGTTGVYQTFTASTVPAQPNAGETWDLEYSGTEDWLTVAGNVATYDSDTLYATAMHPNPPELSDLHERFRFTRTVAGIKTYGDWIDFDITLFPYFAYPASGPGYRVFVNEKDPSAVYMQVMANTPVDIPATPRLNANHTASSVPSMFSEYIKELVLPPGLTLNSDGSISGTVTSGPSDWRYEWGRPAAVDGSSSIYGMNEINVAVVTHFRPTMEEYWWIPDASDPDGGPNDPDDPDDPDDEEPPIVTTYRIVTTADPDGSQPEYETAGLSSSYLGLTSFGTVILLETTDHAAAEAAWTELAAEHGPKYIEMRSTEDANQPFGQWYSVHGQNGFLAYGWATGGRIAGVWEAGCPPAVYQYGRATSTYEGTMEYLEWQRSLVPNSPSSASILKYTYGSSSFEVLYCEEGHH